ncbi:HNH endonuclease signature motif containing protein [Hymenobacter metallilatus]|uniref:HNH endonuclease n=1 Tax=Hymenobacter metallilatus TaxID=2493666 RepID=A0A428JD23_9BACT|nr:HNH endonuclease [Hymenobacter metallilatus]
MHKIIQPDLDPPFKVGYALYYPPKRVQNFWDSVKKEDRCWVWQRGLNRTGYGQFCVFGSNIYAHRFSYSLHFGPIPDGMVICHKCDNPSCVRPEHLFLGTYSDNTQDAVQKGRWIQSRNFLKENFHRPVLIAA